MVKKALFVRLEAQDGRAGELEALLRGAAAVVQAEAAHLQGAVAAALASKGGALLSAPPKVEHADVLARKA